MKHKHADLIHAWADGAEIQVQDIHGGWMDIGDPGWMEDQEYRIKPEEKKPVVRWLWAYTYNGDWLITSRFFSDEEASKQVFKIKLEWSRTEFPE